MKGPWLQEEPITGEGVITVIAQMRSVGIELRQG